MPHAEPAGVLANVQVFLLAGHGFLPRVDVWNRAGLGKRS